MSATKTRTRFVIMAGLPGTGKTELSKALAIRLGGIVLSKDKVRAALFPSGAINYASDQNDFCMSVILVAAQRIAAEDNVPFVFFDGRTFSRRRHVEEVIHAAAEVNADYRILHLSRPNELALERISPGSRQPPRSRSGSKSLWENEGSLRAHHGG